MPTLIFHVILSHQFGKFDFIFQKELHEEHMLKTERLEDHGESFGHHRQSNFEFWSLTLLIIFDIEVPFLFLVQQSEPPVMENVAVYGKGK